MSDFIKRSPEAPQLLRIRGWDQKYENNRTRELKTLGWFTCQNNTAADDYTEIVDHPDGAAHFGAWVAIEMIGSTCKPRGLLIRENGAPHDANSLSRLSRMPAELFEAVIPRLQQIGLLETASFKQRKTKKKIPHPAAEISRDDAATRRKKGLEGNRTEQKGIEQNHHRHSTTMEMKGTEPKGTERAPELSQNHDGAAANEGSTNALFSKNADDDDPNPAPKFATPADELKSIYLAKAGEPIAIALLDAIRADLELCGVDLNDFIAEVRKHVPNDWRNPAGFLRNFAKRFRSKTMPAGRPVTAAEADEAAYKCPHCGSKTRGEGLKLTEDGKEMAPCSCASAEYIEHQRARGFLKATA